MQSIIDEMNQWALADDGDDWLRVTVGNASIDIDNVRDDHGMHDGYYAQLMIDGVTVYDAASANRRGVVVPLKQYIASMFGGDAR